MHKLLIVGAGHMPSLSRWYWRNIYTVDINPKTHPDIVKDICEIKLSDFPVGFSTPAIILECLPDEIVACAIDNLQKVFPNIPIVSLNGLICYNLLNSFECFCSREAHLLDQEGVDIAPVIIGDTSLFLNAYSQNSDLRDYLKKIGIRNPKSTQLRLFQKTAVREQLIRMLECLAEKWMSDGPDKIPDLSAPLENFVERCVSLYWRTASTVQYFNIIQDADKQPSELTYQALNGLIKPYCPGFFRRKVIGNPFIIVTLHSIVTNATNHLDQRVSENDQKQICILFLKRDKSCDAEASKILRAIIEKINAPYLERVISITSASPSRNA